MTTQWYVHDILQPHELPLMARLPGAFFQHDNFQPHTSRKLQNCLHHITTLPWPAISQDLLPIEHIWGHLGRQGGQSTSLVKLEARLQQLGMSQDPILIQALSFSYEIPFNCYMMYSLYKKPYEDPQVVPVSTRINLGVGSRTNPFENRKCLHDTGTATPLKEHILSDAEIHLRLNLEVSEYHPSHLSRGAQLSIHSPYHVPSPVSEGLFLNMGTVYRIYVRLAEKNLLPPPYKSSCFDYLAQWRENGGTGPVTEKMCKEKCKLEKSLSLYGCAERRIDYPHNKTICREPIPNFAKNFRAQCAESCSSPCKLKVIPLVMCESLEGWMPTQTSSSYLDQGSESRGPSPLAPSCVRVRRL
ncbi:uncharacterized protein TNCV_3100381 [Trichonephila clavipes]|nr:uncharacterized protein TNCV_3100381 [Trichonephila clavipes]